MQLYSVLEDETVDTVSHVAGVQVLEGLRSGAHRARLHPRLNVMLLREVEKGLDIARATDQATSEGDALANELLAVETVELLLGKGAEDESTCCVEGSVNAALSVHGCETVKRAGGGQWGSRGDEGEGSKIEKGRGERAEQKRRRTSRAEEGKVEVLERNVVGGGGEEDDLSVVAG